ncbi:hypothetical protein C7S16_3167 [Burkholderia thailandensis]|uniref:Lipoprotein n=1 Tax=Burkholderia thailandensis TaxID=57975 RepID=A0AAW9D5J6_BURTH|nr:hypothetical protein [Burkholderia thailandensis]MDW9257231.1 hypothetical protein [Burkholderia thailandensis]
MRDRRRERVRSDGEENACANRKPGLRLACFALGCSTRYKTPEPCRTRSSAHFAASRDGS